MMARPSLDELFERRITLPDSDSQSRLARLVGLDDYKSRLEKILGLLLDPSSVENWLKTHHPGAESIIDVLLSRPPLVVLEGDVGTGKSELAETVGDLVARRHRVDITLFPISLSTRGSGRVGEMTQLLSAAFDCVIDEAIKLKRNSRKASGGVILLIDEADALAQSREAPQMHHEDRAGVNALIRGVDRLGNDKCPAAVIMCTNRIGALDPAIRRRAADILKFTRPNKQQRLAVIGPALRELGFSDLQIATITAVTGKCSGDGYGFTFSDLTQRLLPKIVLDAYPTGPVDPNRALEIARNMAPTPPFQEGRS